MDTDGGETKVCRRQLHECLSASEDERVPISMDGPNVPAVRPNGRTTDKICMLRVMKVGSTAQFLSPDLPYFLAMYRQIALH